MTNREDMSGWQRQHGVRHVAGRRSPSLEETKRKVAAHAQERTAHQAYAPIGLPFREPTEAVETLGERRRRGKKTSGTMSRWAIAEQGLPTREPHEFLGDEEALLKLQDEEFPCLKEKVEKRHLQMQRQQSNWPWLCKSVSRQAS
jgi:hypothetical protein